MEAQPVTYCSYQFPSHSTLLSILSFLFTTVGAREREITHSHACLQKRYTRDRVLANEPNVGIGNYTFALNMRVFFCLLQIINLTFMVNAVVHFRCVYTVARRC